MHFTSSNLFLCIVCTSHVNVMALMFKWVPHSSVFFTLPIEECPVHVIGVGAFSKSIKKTDFGVRGLL